MSTILETEATGTGTEKPDEPTDLAERHRQSIISGKFSVEICDRLNQTKSEFDGRHREYVSRVEACETLKTKVPELERAAAELEAAARTNSDLRSRAIQAREFAYNARHRAERTLLETADVPPDPVVSALEHRISELRRSIELRKPVLQAAEQIPQQREQCERAWRGEVEIPRDPLGQLVGLHDVARQRQDILLSAKRRLAALIELAAGYETAIAENERDEAEVAKLQGELRAATEAHRAKMFAPQNMRWQ